MLQGFVNALVVLLFRKLFSKPRKDKANSATSADQINDSVLPTVDHDTTHAKKHSVLPIVIILLVLAAPALVSLCIAVYSSTSYSPSSKSIAPAPSVSPVVITSNPAIESRNKFWATYYSAVYPTSWAFISEYADDPVSYIHFYQTTWGDLQAAHGDGIPTVPLSSDELLLINFPVPSGYIWVASGDHIYHNTSQCYMLLSAVSVDQYSLSSISNYAPCSVCVGE